VHIAIGPDDTVWVTDRGLRGVYVFDEDGNFIRKFVPNGDASFEWAPLAIAFGPDGDLYVTDVGDSDKHRVLVFAPSGKLIAEWGSTKQVEATGESPGQFLFPNGLAVTGTGSGALVYVADGNNRRIQAFRPDGTFVRILNTSGTPRGLTIDRQQRLYVVDALAHRVDIYSDKGVVLTGFGQNGSAPGEFNLPNDVALDGRGRIFITDREHNQVQVWGFSVADIPGVTKVTPGSAWVLLLPLPLLLIPLLLRRRRFVTTPDFMDRMIDADLVPEMTKGRWRWVMSEADAALFEDRTVDGVVLGDLLHGEPYSLGDAEAIKTRLAVTMERAGLLAMAKRYKTLCTEDPELGKLAVVLGIDVYDRAAWMARFGKKK